VSRELIARHDVEASLDTFENLYRQAIGTDEHLPSQAGTAVPATFAELPVPMVSISAGAVRP
jgi:hypothetical protein